MPLFSREKEKTDTVAPPEPEVSKEEATEVEALALRIGRELLGTARSHRTGVLSAKFWSDQLMNWAMKDPAFKVQLFRFVDVFPMLKSSGAVHEYLVDYLSQPGVSLPPGMDLGLKAGGIAKGILAKTIANRIGAMAGNFIAGVDAASAVPKLKKLWAGDVAFSVDLLGEACVSDEEALVYRKRYLDLIESLPAETRQWPANQRLETDHLGPIPRTNVSIKISSLCARTDPIDFDGSLGRLTEALRPILEAAARHDVLVNFDMEQASMKELTIALFKRCCEQIDFTAGIALQAYLRTGLEDVKELIRWARRAERQVTVRLIKGAYWDYELIHAEQMGWPVPVWTTKRETDACFERMAERLIAAMPRRAKQPGVKLALGSHNVRSIAYALAQLDKHKLPESAVEIQVLHGMADQLKAAVLARGLRVREYIPVGQMIPGMAYLVRRLLENTSNQSWLRAGFSDDVPDEQLLASPHAPPDVREEEGAPDVIAAPAERHRLSPAVEGLADGQPMANEPVHDFSQRDQREQFSRAIAGVAPDKVPGDATPQQIDESVAQAAEAFPTWRDMDPVERSALFVAAAGQMRDHRDELAGIMIRESGKPWREADADVCEAIDFCEYYARSAVELFQPNRLGRFVGELNETWYQPRGVAAVISPWNFPLAITAGMTVAALVTGNTAILKPSPRSPSIARTLCEILWQVGVPPNALHFVPGGGEVGAALVRDPRVAMIAFTGSKQVGLDIVRAAAEPRDGQNWVKRVVCEMGGKNAIIVDDSADLDEAVLGVRQSAFGYAGQKCSACSRVIVLDGVYDLFLKRLVESTRTLVVGDPLDPATDVGPVIDQVAAAKIHEYLEIGRNEGRLELACDVPEGLEEKVDKPFVGPHVFSGITQQHRLANEEVFGPVLAVIRAASFDEALEVANATSYKLTGGVFSRSPAHLAAARWRFRVGNLYLNRGITGALVGRQPFGGFGLSGGGTKAGGRDYLRHFVEPRCTTENTMRHGFAPGLE